MFRTRKPDALQGTLDLLVLTVLRAGPQHGYAIAAQIQARSQDVLRVEEGSLYPALHRMEQAGWIAAEWQVRPNGRRARVYRLTRSGQKRLSDEQARWSRLTEAIARVVRFA